jgi:type IV pilus assembly protein PilV
MSLLEVLVAIVVLALGLLGLAALQMTSLKGGHGAYLRSQAAQLAYDMSDRIRANRESAPDYVFALPDPRPACDRALAPAGTLPQRDVAEWLNSLACVLPAGNGRVQRVAGTDVYDISVRWIEREADEEGGTDGELELRVQL